MFPPDYWAEEFFCPDFWPPELEIIDDTPNGGGRPDTNLTNIGRAEELRRRRLYYAALLAYGGLL